MCLLLHPVPLSLSNFHRLWRSFRSSWYYMLPQWKKVPIQFSSPYSLLLFKKRDNPILNGAGNVQCVKSGRRVRGELGSIVFLPFPSLLSVPSSFFSSPPLHPRFSTSSLLLAFSLSQNSLSHLMQPTFNDIASNKFEPKVNIKQIIVLENEQSTYL